MSIFFTVTKDIVKDGVDEEGWDIEVTVYNVECQTEYGVAHRYTGNVVDKAHAERLVEIFTIQHKQGRLRDDQWCFDRNMYGSQAYLDNYVESEMARMDDEELEFHRRRGTFSF